MVSNRTRLNTRKAVASFLRKIAQLYNTVTPNWFHKMYDNRSPDENSTQLFFVLESTERCKIVCTNFLQVKIAPTTVL